MHSAMYPRNLDIPIKNNNLWDSETCFQAQLPIFYSAIYWTSNSENGDKMCSVGLEACYRQAALLPPAELQVLPGPYSLQGSNGEMVLKGREEQSYLCSGCPISAENTLELSWWIARNNCCWWVLETTPPPKRQEALMLFASCSLRTGDGLLPLTCAAHLYGNDFFHGAAGEYSHGSVWGVAPVVVMS